MRFGKFGDRKGSAVKTVWVCVLLSLLSIVAYGGISDALSGAGQSLSETPASQSSAATPPSLDTPVAAIALDAPSGSLRNRDTSTPVRAPAPTNNGGNLAANLSEYVYLHETRNESISAPAAARFLVCSD
jgi:hypothetical protein